MSNSSEGLHLVSKSEGGTALKSRIFSSRMRLRVTYHFMCLHPWLLTGTAEVTRRDSSLVIVVY